jgi:hypothetical protein
LVIRLVIIDWSFWFSHWSFWPSHWSFTALDLPGGLRDNGGMSDSAASDSGNSAEANLPRILSVLDLLTEEELLRLNHVIVQRLGLMQQIRAHGAMMNFRIGQRVRFTDSSGQVVHGTIARHNRKSVTLITGAGVQWRVAPGLLEAE